LNLVTSQNIEEIQYVNFNAEQACAKDTYAGDSDENYDRSDARKYLV
jgi:hypothetical protein